MVVPEYKGKKNSKLYHMLIVKATCNSIFSVLFLGGGGGVEGGGSGCKTAIRFN